MPAFRRRDIMHRRRSTVASRLPARKFFPGASSQAPSRLMSMNPPARVVARTTDLKVIDVVLTPVAVNTTGATLLLSGIAEGDGRDERVGLSVMIRAVQANLTVSSDTATTSMRGRVSLVWDKQPNSALATYGDIYVTVSPTSFKEVGRQSRFEILWEKDFCNMGNQTAAQQIVSGCQVVKGNRAVNKRQHFNGDDALITSIMSGVLLLAWVGDKAAGTTDGVLAGNVRVTYVD